MRNHLKFYNMKKIPKFLGWFKHQVGDNEHEVDWVPNIDYFTTEQALLICDVVSGEDEVKETYPNDEFEKRYLTQKGVKIEPMLDN